jgi:hypothetical protein
MSALAPYDESDWAEVGAAIVTDKSALARRDARIGALEAQVALLETALAAPRVR